MRRISVAIVALVGVGSTVATASSPHVYRGNGGETLPPVRVTGPSTLEWAASGGVFQIFSSGEQDDGSVNSSASKGWTYVAPGRYTLQINAVGNWALEIEPGIVAPQKLAGGYVGYTGNGGLDLPPIRLPRSEEIDWTNTGSIFQIFDNNFSNSISVNSQGHSGATYAGAGEHEVSVNAIGNWKIAWRP